MVIHKVGRVIPVKERQRSYMNYIMEGIQTTDQIRRSHAKCQIFEDSRRQKCQKMNFIRSKNVRKFSGPYLAN